MSMFILEIYLADIDQTQTNKQKTGIFHIYVSSKVLLRN